MKSDFTCLFYGLKPHKKLSHLEGMASDVSTKEANLPTISFMYMVLLLLWKIKMENLFVSDFCEHTGAYMELLIRMNHFIGLSFIHMALSERHLYVHSGGDLMHYFEMDSGGRSCCYPFRKVWRIRQKTFQRLKES